MNYMVVLSLDRGRLFHTIVIEKRYWDMWSIILMLLMQLYILQNHPAGYCFHNDLLSRSNAIPTKCWGIRVKSIFCYLNSTCDISVFVRKNP